jgi:hypothetical protein
MKRRRGGLDERNRVPNHKFGGHYSIDDPTCWLSKRRACLNARDPQIYADL